LTIARIDDFPLQMKHQPKNGIIIKRFFDDSQDQELVKLTPFLVHISKLDKVTPVAKHMFEFFSTESQKRIGKIRPPFLDSDSQDSLDVDNHDTCDSMKGPKNVSERGLLMTQSGDKKHFTLTSWAPLSKTIRSPRLTKECETQSLGNTLNEKISSLTARNTIISRKPSLKKLNPKDV